MVSFFFCVSKNVVHFIVLVLDTCKYVRVHTALIETYVTATPRPYTMGPIFIHRSCIFNRLVNLFIYLIFQFHFYKVLFIWTKKNWFRLRNFIALVNGFCLKWNYQIDKNTIKTTKKKTKWTISFHWILHNNKTQQILWLMLVMKLTEFNEMEIPPRKTNQTNQNGNSLFLYEDVYCAFYFFSCCFFSLFFHTISKIDYGIILTWIMHNISHSVNKIHWHFVDDRKIQRYFRLFTQTKPLPKYSILSHFESAQTVKTWLTLSLSRAILLCVYISKNSKTP